MKEGKIYRKKLGERCRSDEKKDDEQGDSRESEIAENRNSSC